MRGFFTLDEAFQLSPFRRGVAFFIEGFYKGVAVVLYDWKESGFVFDNNTISSGNGQWIGGYGQFTRKPLSTGGDYTNKAVPYIHDDSGTLKCRFCDVGHTRDSPDDFIEVAEGSRLGSGGPQAVLSDTGITFNSTTGEMDDGDHYVQWRWKHDAKSDTSFAYTTVLSVASNVVSLYSKRAVATSYTSVEDTKDAANLEWQFTWDPSDNTWTVDDDTEKRFDAASPPNPGSNNSDVSFVTSGGAVQQEIDGLDADAPNDDYRTWSMEVEEV